MTNLVEEYRGEVGNKLYSEHKGTLFQEGDTTLIYLGTHEGGFLYRPIKKNIGEAAKALSLLSLLENTPGTFRVQGGSVVKQTTKPWEVRSSSENWYREPNSVQIRPVDQLYTKGKKGHKPSKMCECRPETLIKNGRLTLVHH